MCHRETPSIPPKRLQTPQVDRPALHSLEPRVHFATHPLSDVPLLHSRPGAAAQLYLDLDGQPAENWGFNPVPATPAYDTDGDATTFSDTELAAIRQIWAAVSEKYAPFNIDVTTADPDPISHNYPHNQVYRVVIGGSGAWTGSTTGGITLEAGTFYTWYDPNTSYVFSKNLSRVNSVADAAAHEAGHGFGLLHQSSYSGATKTAEYNPGDASTAPLMGNSYNSARALWWNGPSATSSTTIQDDLSILANANNGFGYAADDHGDNIASADLLSASGDTLTGDGVIGNTSDKDYFKFTTIGGAVSFTATPGRYVLAQTGSSAGSMLDLTLQLRDGSGNLITSADTASMGETVSATLAAGTYYLIVASHGNYGDIGSYAISGSAPSDTVPPPPPPPPAAPVANTGGPYTVAEGATVNLNGSSSTGTGLTYAWDLDGDGIFGETGGAATRGDETGATPNFSAVGLDGPSTVSVSLRVTDSNNATSTASCNISITNVAPSPTITGAPTSSPEGTAIDLTGSATDPGSDSITYGWSVTKNGQAYTTGTGSSFSFTPDDNASYIVTLTATDKDGTSNSTNKTIAVTNVAPSLSLTGSASVNEGSLYTLTLGNVSDPGADTVTQFIVHWGDGSTSTYNSAGNKTHTFADGPASRNVTVDLVDEDGTFLAVASKSMNVNNVAPTLTLSGNSSVTAGQLYTLTLSHNDPGSDTLSGWSINWGDGATQTVSGSVTTATHSFSASDTPRTISATATDEDDTYSAGNSIDVTVNTPPADTTPPTATLSVAPVTTAGAATYTFTVRFDDDQAVRYLDLDSSDLTVTGPNGFSQSAAFVSVNVSSDGSSRTATYRITPPGGTWDSADNGTYTVTLNADQVHDTSDNPAAAGSLGTFTVNAPAPDLGGNTLATSSYMGILSNTYAQTVQDFVTRKDRNDYFRVRLKSSLNLGAKLYGLTDNAQLQLLDINGKALFTSTRSGTTSESIAANLAPGTYYVRVCYEFSSYTPYYLRISGAPTVATRKRTPAHVSPTTVRVPTKVFSVVPVKWLQEAGTPVFLAANSLY